MKSMKNSSKIIIIHEKVVPFSAYFLRTKIELIWLSQLRINFWRDFDIASMANAQMQSWT